MSTPAPADETMGGAIARNPVVQTLALMVLVSAVAWIGMFVGYSRLFVLATPLSERPWGLVTSVYAHLGPGHLLANAVIIAIAGGIVALSTSTLRFHLFFLTTGVLAGVVQVLVFHLQGTAIAVLGASGAAFALVGYVLTSNVVSQLVAGWLGISFRIAVVVFAVAAAWLTIEWSAPGSALLAHFTGAVLGLIAGHFRVLHTS